MLRYEVRFAEHKLLLLLLLLLLGVRMYALCSKVIVRRVPIDGTGARGAVHA